MQKLHRLSYRSFLNLQEFVLSVKDIDMRICISKMCLTFSVAELFTVKSFQACKIYVRIIIRHDNSLRIPFHSDFIAKKRQNF